MRVTKAIREYVEEEIRKKYDEVVQNVCSDYYKERADLYEHIQAIIEDASMTIEQYITQRGFTYKRGYRDDNILCISGNIVKEDQEVKANNERVRLRNQMREKTKQVLFDLEMGETAKAELKDVLDNLTID